MDLEATKEKRTITRKPEKNGNKIFTANFGLLRLWPKQRRKRENANSLWAVYCDLPEPSQPHFFPMQKKKRREDLFYGRFLTTKIMTTPMIPTKMNSPAIAGIKY